MGLLRRHMGVDRRRHHRVLVTQTLGDDMQRLPGFEERGGVRVPERVRLLKPHAGLLYDRMPVPAQVRRVQRTAVDVAEHVLVVHPSARLQLARSLVFPVGFE
jgi:hypothetical protein